MSANAIQAQETPVPVTLRTHTILGVCEAIGEDFGFNPIILRVILATGVLINAEIAIGAYFALGIVVLVSRLLFPQPKAATAQSAAVHSDNDESGREMPIAA